MTSTQAKQVTGISLARHVPQTAAILYIVHYTYLIAQPACEVWHERRRGG